MATDTSQDYSSTHYRLFDGFMKASTDMKIVYGICLLLSPSIIPLVVPVVIEINRHDQTKRNADLAIAAYAREAEYLSLARQNAELASLGQQNGTRFQEAVAQGRADKTTLTQR